MQKLLLEVIALYNSTVLLVTHDIDEALFSGRFSSSHGRHWWASAEIDHLDAETPFRVSEAFE
jgi:ABC-type nitrate/sulfonate/bicarbonate transport system ATPase subunit